jgi:hypothetical protein
MFEEKYPKLSSFLYFVKSVEDQNYSHSLVHRAFNKLVDKEDYALREKERLIKWILRNVVKP